jgi:general secretion pathway protein D
LPPKSSRGSHNIAAEEFTLNLKNTDIHSLIETVSKQTGQNFVVDPRVKAKITVISSHEVNGEELYEIFLSVLQVHGYSAVPSGEIVKIVPDVNAKQGSVPMLSRRNDDTDQLVTHVIQVQNVPAAQLVPILRPLVPQQGHLAAYAATNALIITDRAANIDRMARIVRRIDVPDNDEIEVVRLEHASAAEVVRILGTLQQRVAAKGAAAAAPGSPRLAADERTNSVLVSGDRAARLRLRGLIAHLDTPLGSGGNTRVIYLRYANAEDLVAVLKGVQEGQAKQDAKRATRCAA